MTQRVENNDIWLDWDIDYNLPRLNFKDAIVLNTWSFYEMNFRDSLNDNADNYILNIQKFFIHNIFTKLKYSIYHFEDISEVFILSIPHKLKYVLEVKKENYKFCLSTLIHSASTVEEYELCTEIQSVIDDIDDIYKLMGMETINHNEMNNLKFQ